jgi:hypothetical protein
MDKFDLLDAVLPPDGWFAVVGIKGESTIQELVKTREEVDALAQKFMQKKRNVFFGCAKYATDESRKKTNVLAIKSLWLDIDCGEAKAKVNPKTDRPDGYIDQATGLNALREFCTTIGLPKPTIVNSGRGLHVYWIFPESVDRLQWEPAAEKLRDLCLEHKFYVDSNVFDAARILRIPETLNFKDEPPTQVSVITVGQPTEFDTLKNILGVKPPVPSIFNTMRLVQEEGLSELTKSIAGNTIQKFSTIMKRGEDGCQQLNHAFLNQADIPEPLWWSALTVANQCVDKQKAIHMMSNQHPDYDFNTTERKAAQGGTESGPHRCATFEKHNPGGCDGCKWKGKIHGPIALSKEVLEEEPEEVQVEEEEVDEELVEDVDLDTPETYKIPAYPKPYLKGANGAIYLAPNGEEAEPFCVYEHALYVVKRMRDPELGHVNLLRLHLPMDGVVEFVVPQAIVAVKEELRKVLAKNGVAGTPTQMNHLASFVNAFVKNLQYTRKVEIMRTQFGWADNNTKFVLGELEISKDGVYGSPPSSTTKAIAQHIGPVGDFNKWKEAFNMYARPGMEPHAFAALTAFGAPLFKFTGLKGAIINVIYKYGGSGKSTTLFMCNSVYGHPESLGSIWKDTNAAKIQRMGIMNNLPYTVDEITNITPEDFSNLAYSMSQGRGSDRMKGASNELRDNSTTWQTISLASANASFYEKLASVKAGGNAEMLRLFEYEIAPNNVISTEDGKRIFDRQLKENYGHAGEIYIKYLVNNLPAAVEAILNIQKKIDMELKLTPPERFWSAVAACNIAGGLIAKNLGLADYDMKDIYTWVCKTIQGMRDEIRTPSDDATVIVGDYINRNMQNILVVKGELDNRTAINAMPSLEPRGELRIRYEPDTKSMFFVTSHFKKDCVERQINYKDTVRELRERGYLVATPNKRMSKGMKITSPAVHTMQFDCTKDGFIDMEGLIVSELEDADRDADL